MGGWLNRKIKLGKTELYAARFGIGAAYGAPADALEAAFEEGCNYFYWGALRNAQMATAIRNIVNKGKQDDLIVVIQDFRRSRVGVERSLMRGLKKLGMDYADVLLLGWHKNPPNPRVLDAVEKLKGKQAFRYLGISGHKRALFPELAKDHRYDLFQIRYNAANQGAEEDIFPHLPQDRPGIVSFTSTKKMSIVQSKRIPPDERRPTAGDCYRFVLTNPAVDVVITAPSKAAQLEQNLAEVKKGPLSEDQLQWMCRIGDYVYGSILFFWPFQQLFRPKR
ncbi:MAG: aldo/keto reductase [Candidatus Aminicenantes bacterium]|nr:MAG: aldo/keto reductase [Candidatus Aminicenantes bacterium]